MKIGFVILHYSEIDTTIECINSILQLDQNECIEIIIVDNHSPNETGKMLKEKYCGYSNIHVILLNKNYGFSRANNIGYLYAIQNYDMDFVVVSNNDIIFGDKSMLEKLQVSYNKRKYYIGGPDIYAVYKREHQSPLASKPRDKKEIKAWIAKNKKYLRYIKITNWFWIRINHTKLYKSYINFLNWKRKKRKDVGWKLEMDNVVLSGACLFVSKKYIDLGVKLFEPETRFYHEEDILSTRCLFNKWKLSYIPQIRVEHLEGVSTNLKGYCEKNKFRYINFIESGKVYLKYLKELEKKNFENAGNKFFDNKESI